MEHNENEKHSISNDGGRDYTFTGRQIAGTISSHRHDSTRWTEIDIYQTLGGTYVVHVVGRSQWQGEHDRHTATVCATEADVIDALTQDGYLSDLAKEALDAAGIEHAVEID